METLRMTTAALTLVLGLALLAPATARAQEPIARVGTGPLILAAANTYQSVRVTVGYPALISPAPDGASTLPPTGTVTFFDGNGVATVAIAPGDFFTYTIDPRVAGRLVDPKTGLRHVPVHFEFSTEAVEGIPAPTPSVTIELVHVRTGEVQSVHAFPGYTGVTHRAAPGQT